MWHTKNIKEIEKELRTNIKTGLGDKDVQIRQDEFGKNKIEEGKKESLLVKFLNQFKDFMIIILIIASRILMTLAGHSLAHLPQPTHFS